MLFLANVCHHLNMFWTIMTSTMWSCKLPVFILASFFFCVLLWNTHCVFREEEQSRGEKKQPFADLSLTCDSKFRRINWEDKVENCDSWTVERLLWWLLQMDFHSGWKLKTGFLWSHNFSLLRPSHTKRRSAFPCPRCLCFSSFPSLLVSLDFCLSNPFFLCFLAHETHPAQIQKAGWFKAASGWAIV